METLHSTLTHMIAFFSSAAPILFALVSLLTAVLNFILRLDRRRTPPILDDGRAKFLRTVLSYLANTDLGMEGGSRGGGMRAEHGRR